MASIRLDSICTTYYDINGNLIAVATQDVSRDGSKKFKLYRTDENLEEFDLVSTDSSPISFDAILYPNHILSASKSKNTPIRNKIHIDKPTSEPIKHTGTKRKKLF